MQPWVLPGSPSRGQTVSMFGMASVTYVTHKESRVNLNCRLKVVVGLASCLLAIVAWPPKRPAPM